METDNRRRQRQTLPFVARLLIHKPSTQDGVHSDDATDAVVVRHGDVAFVSSGELYVDRTSRTPLLMDVLEGKATGIVDIADDVRSEVGIGGIGLVHTDFNPVCARGAPTEVLCAADV